MLLDAPKTLQNFKVNAANKGYEFWQRDSLAIKISSREMALQKLDYIRLQSIG
jgi:hypothetical protein